MKTASKSEIFTWMYQTVNMPIVFGFACWLKYGITHQNQIKTDIAVKKLWLFVIMYQKRLIY
jgi:hypothetical protein